MRNRSKQPKPRTYTHSQLKGKNSPLDAWFNHSRSEGGHWRPQKRSDCENIPRPCPYVGCRHHLCQDVAKLGSIKINFPFLFPWEMPVSCSLDVAEDGGCTLEDVGEYMNLGRERVRQLEESALDKIRGFFEVDELTE